MRVTRAKPQVTVMGLDASLNSSGTAYRGMGGELVTGRIKPGTKKGCSRLWHNLKAWERLLDSVQPGLVVIEGYAMSAKGNAMFNIGEWGGVARLAVWQRGIPFVTVTPSTLKMLITGNGAAKKPQVIAALHKATGELVPQEDEADAYALMLIGEALHGRGAQAFVQAVEERRDAAKPGIYYEAGMIAGRCN